MAVTTTYTKKTGGIIERVDTVEEGVVGERGYRKVINTYQQDETRTKSDILAQIATIDEQINSLKDKKTTLQADYDAIVAAV